MPSIEIVRFPKKNDAVFPAYLLPYGFPSGAHNMVSREQVEAVLGRIRPMMQADGGDIELVDLRGNSAHVRLTGMCAGCPSAHMTLYMGVEMALRDEIKEFEELVVV